MMMMMMMINADDDDDDLDDDDDDDDYAEDDDDDELEEDGLMIMRVGLELFCGTTGSPITLARSSHYTTIQLGSFTITQHNDTTC